MTEGDDFFEEAFEDALHSAGGRLRTGRNRPRDEVGDTRDDAGIGFRLNLFETGWQQREATAEKDLSVGHRRATAGGRGDHVPLHVGVTDDGERAKLRHDANLGYLNKKLMLVVFGVGS